MYINNYQKKILFIRNDKIGDLLLTLPVIKAAKDKYPDYKISILVSEYTSNLLNDINYIDEIIVEKEKHKSYVGLLKLIKRIRKNKYDVGIILYPCWRNAIVSFLSLIPIRIGTGYKLCSILFNKKVYVHRTKNKLIHETDYCLKHLKYFNINHADRKINLTKRKKDEDYIKKLLDKFKIEKEERLIAIHPGNGRSALNWSVENFIRLIDLITKDNRIRVVLTGTNGDKEIIEKIKDGINKDSKVINLFNQTNINQLQALLSFCNFFIGTSTGPMHLAAAVKTRVIALFSPLLPQRPEKWSPLGEGHTIVLPEGVNCSRIKCILKKCKYYNCMDKIKPEVICNILTERINNEKN
ncbi:MAG: glycosyltransferase family 9 protein [bacterium]|nr:glycosyltransferase family 9 protein [bacterium]